MLRLAQLLGFRPKHPANDSHGPADAIIRLLAITTNDRFYAGLVDIATSCGWEIRRASAIREGLDILRSLSMPLVVFDWDENGHDWRDGIGRLGAAPNHPCVLLASRVIDENLRQEVMRFHGYDVLARSADKDQIIRTIRFAWFWTTRSRRIAEGANPQEARH